MYKYDPNKKIETGIVRGTAYRPETRKFFQARATERQAIEADKFADQKKNWLNVPMKTISRGLDYLSTFNPLESAEAIGGMVKDSLSSAKKFAKAPLEIYRLAQYDKEVKELEDQKKKGKISDQAYASRMNVIGGEAKRLSQEYDPKTAVSDALSAATLFPTGSIAKSLVGEGVKFIARGGVKETIKGITKESLKRSITPTIPKAPGIVSKAFQRATLARPMSTPVGKSLFKASTKLAEGKAISDTFSKVTGREITPVKLMKEGPAREITRVGGMIVSPIPYIGKAFKGISKTKKYIATATETQAGESAFGKYFGKEVMKLIPDKQGRSDIAAQAFRVMKERAIPVNEKNIISHLKDSMNPGIDSLSKSIISNSIKRVLKANGIEKINDASKMTDEMLEGVLKNKKDVKALREAIEEMGKTSITGVHFKTKEEQLKALIVFEYTGVHTGTFLRSADELRNFVNVTYDKIMKGTLDIKGPLKGLKFEGAPVPVTKFKTSEELLETLNKKTAGTIKAIEDMRKAKIEDIGVKGISKVKEEIKDIKEMRRELQKSTRGTRALRTRERAAADAMIKELEKKFVDLSEIAASMKKQAKAKLAIELEVKAKQVFKAQLPKTKALVKAPERVPAFVIKPNKLISGKWDDNRALLGMSKQESSNLYTQGVRDLPKGDVSFMEGRKAELGRTLNKIAEGKLGKLLMPQNSREIYSKIRTKLDASLVKAFGKDIGKAEKVIQKELDEPLVIGVGKFGLKLPIYKPTERELGKKAWRRIISQVTGDSVDSEKVKALAKTMDNDMRTAFVTSMKEAGIPTNLIDKMRSTSGFFNWTFYNLYTLPRFQLRPLFWAQQVPEVYQWGHVRTSKLAADDWARFAGNKQLEFKRTINLKSGSSETQQKVSNFIIGQTEEISGSGARAMEFARRNEANAYGMAIILESDKALNSMPIVRNYLKKHGLKKASEIPILRKKFYGPLKDDAENLGGIIDKYGVGGAKAHLADPTKTVLKKGLEDALFDNAIRDAIKISKPNAYKEAIPLFLYNPNRSMLEKSLHSWPMFPLSYSLKVAERGGGYILEGTAIRSKIFAGIINVFQQAEENENIKKMESKYYNLFNAATSWFPVDPSYDFSTGFLPPFSKMLLRWAENPEYYLDEEKGTERSMKVLWPAYREARGWQQLYNNVKRMQDKVRKSDTMTEAEANKIIEGFRYKEPEKIGKIKMPELPEKPEEPKKKVRDLRTAQEKAFAEKKERRARLLEIKPKKEEEKEKVIPKISVPKTFKPKATPLRPPYSK